MGKPLEVTTIFKGKAGDETDRAVLAVLAKVGIDQVDADTIDGDRFVEFTVPSIDRFNEVVAELSALGVKSFRVAL
jgi:hypothetical protein